MTAPIYRNPGASHARDYRAVDGCQTVTYTAEPHGSAVSASIDFADGHELTARELAALGGLFAAGDKRWFLGADQLALAGITPRQGDTLTDADGVTWAVTGPCVLDDQGVSWNVTTTKARG